MARIARVVVPEFPHHIIQRGNRRQKVFFNEGDYKEYLRLLNNYSLRFKVDILGNWKDFLNIAASNDDIKLCQLHERTGRPLGDNIVIEKLESLLKITLKKKRARRRKKEK